MKLEDFRANKQGKFSMITDHGKWGRIVVVVGRLILRALTANEGKPREPSGWHRRHILRNRDEWAGTGWRKTHYPGWFFRSGSRKMPEDQLGNYERRREKRRFMLKVGHNEMTSSGPVVGMEVAGTMTFRRLLKLKTDCWSEPLALWIGLPNKIKPSL